MNNIVGIIDMDGFLIRKKFYCKELGILKAGNDNAESYFFDLGIQWNELTEQEKKTCNYVMNYIHKLPFGTPKGTESYKQSQLEEIVTVKLNEMKNLRLHIKVEIWRKIY